MRVGERKKQALLISLCILALLLLAGCGGSGSDAPFSLLPEPDPADFPSDFAIRYETWIDASQKSIIDTGEGFVQADLVQAGTAEADFEPSEELLRGIWTEVVRTDLTSIRRTMTSVKLTKSDTVVADSPTRGYKITIRMNGETYTVSGDSTAWHYQKEDEEAYRFVTFCSYMETVETGAFETPPVPVGGYQ